MSKAKYNGFKIGDGCVVSIRDSTNNFDYIEDGRVFKVCKLYEDTYGDLMDIETESGRILTEERPDNFEKPCDCDDEDWTKFDEKAV